MEKIDNRFSPQNIPLDTKTAVLTHLPRDFNQKTENFSLEVRKQKQVFNSRLYHSQLNDFPNT